MYMSSKSDMGRQAWNKLRLALLWARKGGVVFALKKRLTLSHFHQSNKHIGSLQDGDRQLSFDATPMIHFRMHRPNSMRFHLPHIPCLNPQAVDSNIYDFDYHSESEYSYYQPKKSFLLEYGDEEDDQQICDEEEIDVRAEEFISNFYHQLKLQRQISLLQQNQN